jgi:hypothetical protein
MRQNLPLLPETLEFIGSASALLKKIVARQLNHAQLTATAVDMLPSLQEEAKKRQGTRTDLNIPPGPAGSSGGEAAIRAAEIVGVVRVPFSALV